jgi:methylglyoxal synthase|tara:strand:- start:644 stop:1030 length:387 start_codon:yes stop_codon:yes gene_type:complete
MKRIGLVAHDNKKIDMVQFCVKHFKQLQNYTLFATDGTADAIHKVCPNLKLERIGHGPDGGDVHIAYNILEDKFDALLFFIDTQTAHGHEHDIQTLIRTCATKNIPFALNRATARLLWETLDDYKGIR